MAVHWQIKFKSLRAGTDYTVSIYDDNYTGQPVQLMGAAEPFVTKEDSDEDMFTPIRTQSGYLRIVDNGYDANGNTFNWKDILPETDTDRPVILTSTDGQRTTIYWQGFLQAQNFSGKLYGNPQVREFPIQCPLTILGGTDINYQHTDIENFAYLLQRFVNTIDIKSGGTENSGVITANGIIHISNIYVQGNTDAKAWLLKRIDWQNFVDEGVDGNLTARFNLYQCLEDMCRFWGWTVRVYRNNLYLVCADDSSEQNWLTLTRAQLDTLAAGTAAGTSGGSFSTINFDQLTDIFANMNQDVLLQRGPNKATVNSNCNSFNSNIYESFPDHVTKQMESNGWMGYIRYDDASANYTNDVLSFNSFFFQATAIEGKGSFNLAMYARSDSSGSKEKSIRILKTYNGTPYVSLDSIYEHTFDGFLQLKGSIYVQGVQYQEDRGAGRNKEIKMSVGIGKTRSNAKWFDGFSTWGNSKIVFPVSVGYSDNIFRFYSGVLLIQSIGLSSPLTGRIFIDIYGSSNIDEYNGQRIFDIAGFEVSYNRYEYGADFTKIERKSNIEYKSSNNNNVLDEWNADCIYATDNNNVFGFGTIIDTDNTYLEIISYNGGTPTHPEQHLANRVTGYWETSKTVISMEVRSDRITEPSPMNKVTIDSTTGYPIAIGHEWRDDIVILKILEL